MTPTSPTSPTSPTDDRGLLSTELAVLMPVMLLVALLAVFVIDVERHISRSQQAADAAARAASYFADEVSARAAAQRAAESVCQGAVLIEDQNFRFAPPEPASFTPGRVAVGLTCTEDFGDFRPLVTDPSRTQSGVAVAVIEYWRPRS